MPQQVEIYAAISNDGGVFKHWRLFVDGPGKANKIIFNAMGDSGRFRFEESIVNARESATLVELWPLCSVRASNIEDIKKIAREVEIKNQYPGWNCQDYVLELLDALEEARIIDGRDTAHKKQKSKLCEKQEGMA